MTLRPISLLKRFRRDQSGAALVEFAIMMPMMLLMFAVTIEGGRLFWSYQTVVAGVRDAARYVARVAPRDLCTTGGSVAVYQTAVEGIVRNSIGGNTLFPTNITVGSVTPTHVCHAGSYRGGAAPVVQVSADLTVTFPFADLFAFGGGGTLSTINTTISDQSRVFGS